MKILIINGSPHAEGRTMTALWAALAGCGLAPARPFCKGELDAWGIEVCSPRGLSPCVDCGGCRSTGRCVIQDGFEELYRKVEESELVILAFPSYFDSFPAQLKAFIDRLQSRFAVTFAAGRKPELLREGIAFMTAGTDGPQPVSDRTLSHIFAVLGARYLGTVYFGGTDQKAPDPAEAARRLQEIYGQRDKSEN